MSNFATLDSLRKKREEADGNDDGNEYYAGGAGGSGGSGGGGSGLNVVGRGDRDGARGGDSVSNIFSRAAAEGAGGIEEDMPVTTITFWSNGFTVNDGPLRTRGEPDNDRFLAEIEQGYCPKELVVGGRASAIKIDDKRGEEFVPPKYVAFGGSGAAAGSAQVSAADDSVHAPSASPPVVDVDSAAPQVRVQAVFAGSRQRQVLSFNAAHTVRDLLAAIDASGRVTGPYQLLHAVPPRPVSGEDFDKTLAEAGLAGASVSVKQI